MAERERKLIFQTSQFVPQVQILDAGGVERAIVRIAHEIVERNQGVDDLVVVGLQTGGVDLAALIADHLSGIGGADIPQGTLDATFHRDDFSLRPLATSATTEIPVGLDSKVVVLVDDVLFTGRTVRAALDALHQYGRPRAVQLAVMIDRGHRELPIKADYVGKNIPTRRDEIVDVRMGEDPAVWLGESREVDILGNSQ